MGVSLRFEATTIPLAAHRDIVRAHFPVNAPPAAGVESLKPCRPSFLHSLSQVITCARFPRPRDIWMNDVSMMMRAIALSSKAAADGGGPFGAVVALNGKILGEGVNTVVPGRDPTAHAEISAIRAACASVGSHDLSGATIFTSCEPCPMCLGAIWWARIGRIVFGNTRQDAAKIGFDDAAIYEEVSRPLTERKIPLEQLCSGEASKVFDAWHANSDRIIY
jgi:guanine deaminase